jgi:hypothetical protein
VITSLDPDSAVAGGPAFTLTINGKNFASGAKAEWGTVGLTTKFKTTKELTATVPASLIAKKGTAAVTVTVDKVKSAGVVFTIKPPKPDLSSLTPDTTIAGGPGFTLSVKGKNFLAGAKVKWGTTALVTTFKSSTLLTAPVTGKDIATAKTVLITVSQSSGTSGSLKFVIGPAKPIIGELIPNSATAEGGAFTLTVKGYNFAAGAVVKFAGKALTTHFSDVNEVTASVPATDIATPGKAEVTVTTTKGTSAEVAFTIKPPKPTITGLNPNSASVDGSAFTLTVNGKGFIPGAVITFAGAALPTKYISSTQVSGTVPSKDLVAAKTVEVTVTTAGGTSAAFPFVIAAGKPMIGSLSPSSATAGQGAFTLTVNGSNFIKGATIYWNTTKLKTTIVTPIEVTAPVSASLIATAGTASITVQTSSGTSAPSIFNIVSRSGAACANDGSGNSKLNGVYSFHFTQVDPTKSGQPNLNVGAFTANGSGTISDGLQDSNGPYFAGAESTTFSGTYSIGEDDRGLLTVNYTGGGTANFCFALDAFSGGVAGGGHLVSDITTPQVDSGSFYEQGSTDLAVASVKGSWVLGLQGIALASSNGDEVRGAAAGYVTLDGAGNVSGGELDISQDNYSSGSLINTYSKQVKATGTYTLDATGRGTLVLNLAGGATKNYVFYVAGAQQILVLSTDTGGSGGSTVVDGRGYLRTSTTFGSGNLSGDSVFVDHALTNTNATGYTNRLVRVGMYGWTTGKYTESYDQNDAGKVALSQSSSGTTAVDADGRVTLNTSPATYAYLVSANRGFAVQGNLGVTFTYFEDQSPDNGFSDSSLNGSYSEGSLWYGFEWQRAVSGEVTSNGNGNLDGDLDFAPLATGIVDTAPRRNAAPDLRRPVAMDVGVAETYNAGTNGRVLVMNGGEPYEALYIVSADHAYAINISGDPWQPIEEFNHQ